MWPLLLSLLLAPPATPYEDLAVELLRRYLQIDTTVPPGNELRGARFYQELLEREGIAAEVDEFAPGRANLLAVVAGSGAKRALVLMNHMDVVPADASRWSQPPFSGRLENGTIWGRGAEDMKTEGILQLLALVRLKREAVPLDRDVVFLATADEEADFKGAVRALERWGERLKRAEYLIAEGGENIGDARAGRVEAFSVDVAEKGPLWITLKTHGTPGHGSQPLPDSALNRMVRALDRIRRHSTRLRVVPTVERYFKDQAARVAAPRDGWYRDIRKAVADPNTARAIAADASVSPFLRNTISITVARAGYKTNVIPGTAEAELDVRLLPGEAPEAFLAELRQVIADPSVEIVPQKDFRPPNESPVDTELFRIIERVLGRHYPGVPVTAHLLASATESVLFRPKGVVCYGFTPLVTSEEEVSTAHGDDERISEATVRRSVSIFYEVVRELAQRR